MMDLVDRDLVVVGAALALLALGVSLLWRRRRAPARRADPASLLPRGTSLKASRVLTREEAALYNVLQLVVQDQYLVFPKLPLLRLVRTQALQGEARTALVRQVGLKRTDFALVHPGELTVAKIVEVDTGARPSPERAARNKLVDTLCQSAGIEVIRLKAQASYSVPDLAARLGLGSSDD